MMTDQAIQWLPHGSIDKAKWDSLIQSASNAMIYAQTAWLDAMSPGWDALVLGDYEAVMPLTWRSKMGIRYLCQPAFTQQLGVFAPYALQPSLVDHFLRKTAMLYKLAEIYLNHANPMSQPTSVQVNYVLNLETGYEAICANYKKDLWKNLNRADKFHLRYNEDISMAKAVDLYKSQYADRIGFRDEDYLRFLTCLKGYAAQKMAIARQVTLPDGTLLAAGIFIKYHHRLYNLASTTLPNGRTLEANHVLFDRLIQEFAGSPLLLDFEGSDQPGIGRFYQKFGAANQPYYFWKSNRLPAVIRWWKR